MVFVKFDADNENQNEVVKENKEKAKPVKRKRQAASQKDCVEPRPKSNWKERCKRKAKDIDYNVCKHDLKHLFYVSLNSQRSVPHKLLPDFNVGLNALEDLMDLPKNMYPHCAMSELRSIYYAKRRYDGVDTCYGRTISHDHYYRRLRYARTQYLNTWKNQRQIRKLAQDSVYHLSLYKLAEKLECNPDPFFYGNYDFYYSGGNLCILPEIVTHNVLHVDDNEIGALQLSKYPRYQDVNTATLQECTSVKMPTADEIFEISLLKSANGAQNLAAVRQLNNVTILRMDPIGSKMKMIVDFQTKFAPLISYAQSTEKPEMLVVTTMKQNIRIYDISRPKKVDLKHLYKMQPENSSITVSCWNRIKHWHGETFLYANEHQLMFADFRAPQEDWLKTGCTFSSNEYRCEYNTALALSKFEQLFYVGTTHKLRCLDARYLAQQTHYEQGTVCEWTHQLDYPPAFMDVYRDQAQEYVACASQVAGDLRICELTQSKHLEQTSACDFESHCLPWQPPTLQEAYESANFAGKLLQPGTGFKQRIRACTTGMGFFNLGNDNETQALLMYANSAGDVYAQPMKRRQPTAKDERTTARSDEIMGEFAKKLAELPEPALNLTDIVDMKVMRSVFFSTQLNRKSIKEEKLDANAEQQETAKESSFKRTKGRWRKSMATLQSYKDALVPDILSIWDIPCEDETDIKYSALQNKFKHEKSENNVLNWLNSSDKIAPTTTIPLSNLNMSSMDIEPSAFEAQAQSTQILTQDTYEITFMETDAVLEDTSFLKNTSRTIIAKPKTSKTKKKHVKGF